MEKTSRLSPYFRLSTVTDNRLVAQGSTSGVTNYGYDAVGNLSGYTYPNGVQTSYSYDGLNRLTQMGSAKSGPLSSYVYTLGAAGNRLTVAELSGRTVNYGYDSLYRLTSEAVTADPHNNNVTNGYLYDSVGNRQQWLINGATVNTYTYDADDRLGADQYDADGNTINSLGTANSYDFENHLVQHGTVAIVYDGDGNRVSETVGGVTTDYLVDTVNPTGYAQVVDELVSGAVTRTYAYGLERISESQTLNATWTPSFYGYDGHGSVRQLTNLAGAVTDTYDYDAFGNLINSNGSTPNNYLFAGEQYDPALGLYYNRARYLNTATGRFWTADREEGASTEPLSLNRYLYTSGNPVNMVDPSGNDGELAETIGTLPVAQTIATIAVFSAATACVAVGLIQHGPGFCGSKYTPLTVYRGLSGKNPGQLKPEYFEGDGLSLYEQLSPGIYRFKLPFVIDYLEPKTAGTQAEHIYVPPFLDLIATITYTPEFEDPAVGTGHWSLQVNLAGEVLQLLIRYMKESAIPF